MTNATQWPYLKMAWNLEGCPNQVCQRKKEFKTFFCHWSSTQGTLVIQVDTWPNAWCAPKCNLCGFKWVDSYAGLADTALVTPGSS